MQMDPGKASHQPAMLLAGVLDMAYVRRQVNRMNLVTEFERLVAFVKDPG